MMVALLIAGAVLILGCAFGLGYYLVELRERGDAPETPRAIRRAQRRRRADLRDALRRPR